MILVADFRWKSISNKMQNGCDIDGKVCWCNHTSLLNSSSNNDEGHFQTTKQRIACCHFDKESDDGNKF